MRWPLVVGHDRYELLVEMTAHEGRWCLEVLEWPFAGPPPQACGATQEEAWELLRSEAAEAIGKHYRRLGGDVEGWFEDL